jgi:hypothetical protein
MSDKFPPTNDEPTMALAGGIPLLLNPDIKTAAVIGMGSGISANVLLASPSLQSLDLIEIEAAMVEGAKLFGEHSHRVYNDPRSHIHIDDAKSYLPATANSTMPSFPNPLTLGSAALPTCLRTSFTRAFVTISTMMAI